VVGAWVAGGSAFAVLVGILAFAAQREGRRVAASNGYELAPYSLSAHVLAMLTLAVLAVTIAVALVRSGSRACAVAVLAATAAGPMTIVAVPVRWSLVADSAMDTAAWWHAVVAGAVTALLTAWTVAVAGALPARPSPGVPQAEPRHPSPSTGVLLALLTLLAAAGSFLVSPEVGNEHPGVITIVGWSVLSGAGLIVAARSRRSGTALSVLALSVAAVLAMRAAYVREGGWPGVAGWEFNGMQSPVVLSTVTAVALLMAPIVGGAVRGASARRNRPRRLEAT
jgi:hypothetical protein